MKRTSLLSLTALLTLALAVPTYAQPKHAELKVTHGPILGRPGPTTMSIWVRTSIPGHLTVRYGTNRHILDQESELALTELGHDNTAVITLTGLEPDTEYFYRAGNGRGGSFRTWPDPDHYRHPEHNPEGLFNFQFQYASCNNQNALSGAGPDLPTYDVLNQTWKDQVLFAIMNGDWLYEEDRDFSVEAWRGQVRLVEGDVPEVLKIAPSIAGVWENYKTYLRRGINLSKWHQEVPSYYTFDDHELLNDIYGPGEIGYVNRRAVFRDQGVRAWMDYLGWANPMQHHSPTHFGRAQFQEGSDILYDPAADFTQLKMEDIGTLHVHWGKTSDGIIDMALDLLPGDPNSGVYGIVEVIDRHRLRIEPAARATNRASYSIGRRSYGSFRIANCQFILLQTRSHRTLHDVNQPDKPEASILGKQQFNWLKNTIENSDADFFFLVSSVDFMIPHVGSGGGTDKNVEPKDDAWTVFLQEREELIDFCDERSHQQFFVLTGDLHNSFAIKITDNVWEFASGPANSVNHLPESDEGNRPANGMFKYGPRECQIRWSTYVMSDIPRPERMYPTFCVVQVNNVFNNPLQRGGERWIAYPHPQVIFKYFDGFTGAFLYSESIVAGMNH